MQRDIWPDSQPYSFPFFYLAFCRRWRAFFRMAQNVTIDDRDPILNYSPGWFRTGTYNASSIGQTGTLASSSITAGVNVTFVFPKLSDVAPATEFFYFGVKRCCGGSYLICIDCDPNDRQFETINAVDPLDNGKNPPVVLYSRKFDDAGVHEVILANHPDPAFNGNSQITLDKFLLTVPDPAVQTVYASPTTSALSTAPPSDTGTKLGQVSSSSNPPTGPHSRWGLGRTGRSADPLGDMASSAAEVPAPRVQRRAGASFKFSSRFTARPFSLRQIRTTVNLLIFFNTDVH
ncbi:hypothetical protein MVEN_02047600 [Mycena venus]|uniref:Uncharacterized protein n=1 Tax=Mycena venus TaxID=2733690 RepID=A0A8H6XD13_9AGAR|nr:hypothetical protein MVEN_02047600 [Mycena venus]